MVMFDITDRKEKDKGDHYKFGRNLEKMVEEETSKNIDLSLI